MSKHLFGMVCTHAGAAANNRGETEGNITTLQKLLWNGAVHTTVSAEAIRWALRYRWQMLGLITNRRWDEQTRRNDWRNPEFGIEDQGASASTYIDDDVLGYMSARAAKEEGSKGTTDARRSRLEMTRAVSLTPWTGDLTFNAASIGATPSAAMKGANPVPYGAEVHATRYQFGFAMTPEALAVPSRALDCLEGIVGLGDVGGNHARFLFDFSPESIILRWTDDFAPRLLYCYEPDGSGVSSARLVRAVESGDVRADELVIGGAIEATQAGGRLKDLGAAVFSGVRVAADEATARMRSDLGLAT
ncbi:MAG: type I-B CRISPR-associated protein Cas7/Cst2/DevR [Dehalococcoidia bacterium]